MSQRPLHIARVKLSDLLPHLPDRERDERPAFMRTLALLDALEHLGCPCGLWNAVIESPWKMQVICAVRLQHELLDWHGFNPYDYPHIYPIHLQGVIRRESSIEIVPGKRAQAVERYPEVRGQVQLAMEWLTLDRSTASAAGDAQPLRL